MKRRWLGIYTLVLILVMGNAWAFSMPAAPELPVAHKNDLVLDIYVRCMKGEEQNWYSFFAKDTPVFMTFIATNGNSTSFNLLPNDIKIIRTTDEQSTVKITKLDAEGKMVRGSEKVCEITCESVSCN